MDFKTDIEPLVSGLARHVITGLAGSLVTAGAIQKDQQTQFIAIGSGILVWAAGMAWSAWQKRQQKAQVQSARENSQ